MLPFFFLAFHCFHTICSQTSQCDKNGGLNGLAANITTNGLDIDGEFLILRLQLDLRGPYHCFAAICKRTFPRRLKN